MPAPLVALAVVAAAAGVVGGLRARGSMRRHAQAHGWLYSEQDDALAAAWTLPPFAHPPAPGDLDTGPVRRNARMRQVARFVVEGSEAAALTFEHTHGDVVNRYQVAALRTGQGLPRAPSRRCRCAPSPATSPSTGSSPSSPTATGSTPTARPRGRRGGRRR